MVKILAAADDIKMAAIQDGCTFKMATLRVFCGLKGDKVYLSYGHKFRIGNYALSS